MASSKEQIKAAEILKQSKPYIIPGKLKITEWSFRVPLIHSDPSGETIRLFARSAEKLEPGHIHETSSESSDASSSSTSTSTPPTSSSASNSSTAGTAKPWIFYQSGGPGGACPAPQDASFVRYFTNKGYNVLLLDQRGAGLSSTASARSLQLRGSASAQAAYLKLLRADNIVRDTEAVRLALTASQSPDSKKRISLLGQSFGGFCSVTYLSMFPDSLKEVFLTGGLPPLGKDVDTVYERLVGRAAERSRQYYEKFPEDEGVVRSLLGWVQQQQEGTEGGLNTAQGGRLSEARFRSMGFLMGTHAGFTRMHNLMSRMNNDLETFGFWTRPTMTALENTSHFDDAILYALVHEVIYVDGPGKASAWSAERALKESAHFGQAPSDHPVFFNSGEMITHDTFADHPEIRNLLDVAEILFADTNWPRLYDEEVLAKNTVPVFAAVYHDDLFVDFDFSLDTARAIKGAKLFITNRAYHDGLRSDATQVLDALLSLRDDTLD